MECDGDDDDNGNGYEKNCEMTMSLMHDDGNCDGDMLTVMMRMVVTTLATMMTIMTLVMIMTRPIHIYQFV